MIKVSDNKKFSDNEKVVIVPISEKKKSRIIEFDLDFPPGFLIVICKILNPILTILGFLFLIAGGLYSLLAVYSVWKVCAVSGWHGLIETKYTLHIVLYLVLLFIINRLRYLVYRIADN